MSETTDTDTERTSSAATDAFRMGAGPAAAWVEYQMLVGRLQELHYRDSHAATKTMVAVLEISRARRTLDRFVITLLAPAPAGERVSP